MSACAHRPEDGSSLIPCAAAFLDHKCVCAGEVKADEAEEAAQACDVAPREPVVLQPGNYVVVIPAGPQIGAA